MMSGAEAEFEHVVPETRSYDVTYMILPEVVCRYMVQVSLRAVRQNGSWRSRPHLLESMSRDSY